MIQLQSLPPETQKGVINVEVANTGCIITGGGRRLGEGTAVGSLLKQAV